MVELNLIMYLIIAFQVKHLVVDFLLQNSYMLGKFNRVEWFWPLLSHTSMHGIATLIIAMAFGLPFAPAFGIAILDVVIHTFIDKAKVEVSREYDMNKDKQFWWWLGTDQFAHHMTHYFLVILILSQLGVV